MDTLNIKKYIGESEESKQKFFDWVDSLGNERALLDAPTESGKTSVVRQYMIERPHLRTALLAPTRTLVDNLNTSKDNPTGYGINFILENHNGSKIITTYDTIDVVNNFDTVFVDEAHLLASHSSFRTVVSTIMNLRCKVIFMSGTPEIIDKMKIKQLKVIQKYPVKRPMTIVASEKFQRLRAIQNIIDRAIIEKNKNGYLEKTILIRINSKKLINKLFDLYKERINIVAFYSADDDELYKNQDKNTIDSLKKGHINNIDVLLVTSVLDAGLSLSVDRDIEGYAVSNCNDLMPNPVDMLQLIARIRKDTNYEMVLTIMGKFGALTRDHLTEEYNENDTNGMLEAMNSDYDKLRGYREDVYLDLLGYYGVIVKQEKKSDVDSKMEININVKYLIRMRTIDIIRNLNVINITAFRELRDLAKINNYDFSHLEGLQVIEIAVRGEDSREVNSLVSMLKKAIEYKIPTEFFMDKSVFHMKRIQMLIDLIELYIKNDNADFKILVDSLIKGLMYDRTKINIEGYGMLIKGHKELIRKFSGLLYHQINWRKTTTLKHISETNTLAYRTWIYDAKIFDNSFMHKPYRIAI